MTIDGLAQGVWDYYRPTVDLVRAALRQHGVPYRGHAIVIAPIDRLQQGPPRAYVEIQIGALITSDTVRIFPQDVQDPPQISAELVGWIAEWRRHAETGRIREST